MILPCFQLCEESTVRVVCEWPLVVINDTLFVKHQTCREKRFEFLSWNFYETSHVCSSCSSNDITYGLHAILLNPESQVYCLNCVALVFMSLCLWSLALHLALTEFPNEDDWRELCWRSLEKAPSSCCRKQETVWSISSRIETWSFFIH